MYCGYSSQPGGGNPRRASTPPGTPKHIITGKRFSVCGGNRGGRPDPRIGILYPNVSRLSRPGIRQIHADQSNNDRVPTSGRTYFPSAMDSSRIKIRFFCRSANVFCEILSKRYQNPGPGSTQIGRCAHGRQGDCAFRSDSGPPHVRTLPEGSKRPFFPFFSLKVSELFYLCAK